MDWSISFQNTMILKDKYIWRSLQDNLVHANRSVNSKEDWCVSIESRSRRGFSKRTARDFLHLPLTISVDEDLIESYTVIEHSLHSSIKGLEFPLTIVDVGSDFRRNHHSQRFKRHPQSWELHKGWRI